MTSLAQIDVGGSLRRAADHYIPSAVIAVSQAVSNTLSDARRPSMLPPSPAPLCFVTRICTVGRTSLFVLPYLRTVQSSAGHSHTPSITPCRPVLRHARSTSSRCSSRRRRTAIFSCSTRICHTRTESRITRRRLSSAAAARP